MRTILYGSPFVPPEWIRAHGFTPGLFVPKRPAGEASFLPETGVCPYARAFIRGVLAAAAGGEIAGAVFATACDQMRRGAELIRGSQAPPVFLLNLPSTISSRAERSYRDELFRLGRFLKSLEGTYAGDEALRRAILEYQKLRKIPNPPPPEGAPLALVGGPLMKNHERLRFLIEKAGGSVVLDAAEPGERAIPVFDEALLERDPFGAALRAYFQIPSAFRRPDDALYAWLKEKFTERRVRGVIGVHYPWCDVWRGCFAVMKERLPLPFLRLELDGAGDAADARMKTRVEAFLEALDHDR